MIGHYPNRVSIREPAIEVNNEEDDKKCVRPSFSTLFDSTVLTTFLVPPVGKKPRIFADIEEELKALKEEERVLAEKESAELDGLNSKPSTRPNTPGHGLDDSNRPITPNRPTTPNQGLSTKGVYLSILDGSGRPETSANDGGKSHKHHRKSKSRHKYIVRGINNAGTGPWSDSSYSTYTESAPPDIPKPPFVAKAFLSSLLFEWYAPPDNGALTGYEFCVQHTGKMFKLPRGKLEFLMENFQPGNSYCAKVKI
jgi:hypothetical protein